MAAVEAQPDITLAELAARLEQEHGVRVAASTMHRFLARHRSHVQEKSAHAAEQDRPDVRRRRQAWLDAQPDLHPGRPIFIDETRATTKLARLRGRAPKGERCRAGVPHGHWKTTAFVGALRLGGMTATPSAPLTSLRGIAFGDGPRRPDDRPLL